MSDPNYESEWDESTEESLIWITCPKCRDWRHNPISWGDLDTGTEHKCNVCSYEWAISDGWGSSAGTLTS